MQLKAQGIGCDGKPSIEKQLTPTNYHENGEKPKST
jgi:hypothetical protein